MENRNNDELELTELEQAESIARHVMKNQFAFVADVVAVCRVFLTQQARLAEVERERDAWKDGKFAAVQRAEAAERKATELERERKRPCVMCGGTGEFVNALMQKLVCECCRPAPTEREAAQPSVFRTPAAFSSSIFVTEACADCEALNGNQWSVAGRVYCPKHSITLRPAQPQAAPEPVVLVVKVDDNECTPVLTQADRRRIVETGRQHKENAE